MHNIVIAVTGASGSIYAKGLLDKLMTLRDQWNRLGLLMSANARDVWRHELQDDSYERYARDFSGVTAYSKDDFTAPFASGSGQYNTMVVVPCSMGTLGRIAQGTSSDLLTRAADVALKERRKLILVARETPYNLIHIRNMEQVTLAGGIICPATPSFYSRPQTVEAVAATVVDRIVDLMGLNQPTYRWGA